RFNIKPFAMLTLTTGHERTVTRMASRVSFRTVRGCRKITTSRNGPLHPTRARSAESHTDGRRQSSIRHCGKIEISVDAHPALSTHSTPARKTWLPDAP